MKGIVVAGFIKMALSCLVLFSISSCSEKDVYSKSSDKKIISFDFALTPKVIATIDSTANEITATLPIGTDITKLSPVIEISPLAKIAPESGTVQDFSKPVSYTVTAEDGSTRVYTAKITALKSGEKSLISFKFSELTPEVAGIITDGTSVTVEATVPKGTSLKALKPTIVISPRATINPATSIVQDFSKDVVYKITAENGTTKEVVVRVKEDNPSTGVAKILIGKTWVYSEIKGDVVDFFGKAVAGKSNVTILMDGKSVYNFTPDIAKESYEFMADGTAKVYDSFFQDYVIANWELSANQKEVVIWTGSDKGAGSTWVFSTVSDTKMVVKEEYWQRDVKDSKLTGDDYVIMHATITLIPKK